VVEVIPVVQSRPIPGGETWLCGLFDFRGTLLPLLDSARLLGLQAADYRRSSRILVVRPGADDSNDTGRVGLLVERVLGTERLTFDELAAPTTEFDFLGPVARTGGGTVQLMLPARLPVAMRQQDP
jgi:chemotaxis-related protein WspB